MRTNSALWKALALAVAVVALAACGGSDEDAADTAAATAADTGQTSGEAIKVGLVTDIGQLNDRGFNQLAYQGVMRAERELGIESRVLESASDSDYVPNMSALADEGFDLIVGVGFAQGEAVDTVATEYPDTKFVIIDVDQASLPGKPENVVGLLFREEEVGYLAGYLAALTAKREPGPDVISSVGGMKEPPVDRFIAGYQAGAKKAAPGDRGAERLLAGLGRRRQVQGAGAEPDRRRVGRRLPGRGRLRPRRARRGEGEGRSGGSASTPTSRTSARTC